MYRDFDAMFAEMRGETVPFRVYGREYRIRRDLPAALVLRLARCEGDVPPALVLQAAETIFGADVLAELTAHEDFTLARLERMLNWAFEVCSGGDAPGEDETEAKN